MWISSVYNIENGNEDANLAGLMLLSPNPTFSVCGPLAETLASDI